MPKCDEMCRKCGTTDGVCLVMKLCPDCTETPTTKADIEAALEWLNSEEEFYSWQLEAPPQRAQIETIRQCLQACLEENKG